MANDSSHALEKSPKDDTWLANKNGKEMSPLQTHINLCLSNRGQKHLEVKTIKTAVETDLQAPVSPDNKEHYPPREESEDNQSEKLEDSIKDLERIAPVAIVSIMLSGGQKCLNSSISGPLEASFDCLNWFGGIVCCVAHDVENDLEDLLTDAPGGNYINFASKALEHMEATTFKSAGTKVEDHFCISIDQKNKFMGDTVLPSQQRRGQARKGREWKEFQSEILLPTSSLSCYDATENRRPVKKLKVAARTDPDTIKSRKKVRRISCARGKRHKQKDVLAFEEKILAIVSRAFCKVAYLDGGRNIGGKNIGLLGHSLDLGFGWQGFLLNFMNRSYLSSCRTIVRKM